MLLKLKLSFSSPQNVLKNNRMSNNRMSNNRMSKKINKDKISIIYYELVVNCIFYYGIYSHFFTF